MSEPPVPPPLQPLDYRGPSGPGGGGPEHNQGWKVALRVLAGIGAGIGSGCVGLWLANTWGIMQLFFLPPLVVLGGAIFVAIKWRRHGYVTGLVLAPLVIVLVAFVLLLIICGNMGRH